MAAQALARAVTRLLEGVCTLLWGFPPRLIAPTVIQLGTWSALSWFLGNMPRYERTLARFGPVRTHLLCVAISLVNGCQYCTHGHARALELAYLREHERLFPLDELDFARLCGLGSAAIRHDLVHATQRAGLPGEVRYLDRTLTLVGAVRPGATDEDDLRIIHLVRMLGVLNSVGIRHRPAPDEAHSPLNRDHLLKRRYSALRAGYG
ncbi:hypothetical protein GCM10023321_45030 [Pseudonocardia eucalypti]|uniref:Carboxymuconolactone decarboxylase-like domain-containing protein n=1 Tax=Pseudonocardia eucalypti TaxID=648755 RepID=A0ABP9QFU2_9PSEU|nr:AhpD family alkylhydroperoxidase [Pseudonocardia eucalypti]